MNAQRKFWLVLILGSVFWLNVGFITAQDFPGDEDAIPSEEAYRNRDSDRDDGDPDQDADSDSKTEPDKDEGPDQGKPPEHDGDQAGPVDDPARDANRTHERIRTGEMERTPDAGGSRDFAGDDAESEMTLHLPSAKTAWINSAPLSAEGLKGKAALFYLFEETCPECAGRWPEVLAVANSFASKPIVFVAVNSGSEPQALKAYVRKHRIPFPVLGDYDRSFERELGVNEISLDNILNIQLLKADGKVVAGDWKDLEKSATAALEGADWNVSPKGMPKALQPAWRAIESGEFAKAGKAVTASLKSQEPKVQAAAKRLNDYTQDIIATRMDAAKTSVGSDTFAAYQVFEAIAQDFEGFAFPDSFKASLETWKADPAVGNEIAAMKRFELAKKLGYSASPASHQKARKLLETLVENDGDTQAGRAAVELLQLANSQGGGGGGGEASGRSRGREAASPRRGRSRGRDEPDNDGRGDGDI